MSLTDISEVDVTFKLHLPTFSAKSQTLVKAEAIVKKYGSSVPPIPKDIDEIILKAKERFKSKDTEALTERELRALAFSCFSLKESDSFFSSLLKTIGDANSRRIFSALFSAYIMNFDQNDHRIELASKLLKKNQKVLSKGWLRRLKIVDLLSTKTIAETLAKKILEARDDRFVFDQVGLVGAFSASRLVENTLIAVANVVERRVRAGDTDALYDFLSRDICDIFISG